ncbi:MAG: sarcosine oxidase subunit delta [Chloroflexi bacterium]|nr:sarcosine oxidase subunit delta [Chloroflexota bacterium]
MSFLVPCPRCGPRDVYEFRFGGETLKRPAPDASDAQWADYRYLKVNKAGTEHEWWFHRLGCRRWFRAERDTVENRVLKTEWPG